MLEPLPNAQSASPHLLTGENYTPQVLLPELVAQSGGIGPAIDVGANQGKLLVITLSIDRVVENERLVVSVWGSADAHDWGSRSLLTFTEKYYCGIYSALLNLAKYPAVRHLRVEWKMGRWGKGDPVPHFGFHLVRRQRWELGPNRRLILVVCADQHPAPVPAARFRWLNEQQHLALEEIHGEPPNILLVKKVGWSSNASRIHSWSNVRITAFPYPSALPRLALAAWARSVRTKRSARGLDKNVVRALT